MKIKIRKNPGTNGTNISYFKEPDPQAFRFKLTEKVLSGIDDDIMIFIDTNQRKHDQSNDDVEAILNKKKIKHTSFTIKANDTKMLGINVDMVSKKKKKLEKIFLLDIDKKAFNQSLFDDILMNFDFAICIKKNKTLEQIGDVCRFGIGEVIFNKAFFEDSIYDSVVCSMYRSSFDIAQAAKEIAR